MKQVIAVAALLTLIAGCSASGDSANTSTAAESSAAVEQTDQTSPTDTTPEDDGSGYLLAVSDLPAGWSEVAPGDDETESPIECDRAVDEITPDDAPQVEFKGGDDTPALQQKVVSGPDFYQEFITAYAGCTDGKVKGDGVEWEFTVDELSVDPVKNADQTTAYQWGITATVDGATSEFEAIIYVMQVGNFTTGLIFFDAFFADPDEVAELATLAAAKFP